MLRILFFPPVLSALWLVAVQWRDMYGQPDIIGIAVVFELLLFAFGFVVSTGVYWAVVLPGSYVVFRATGSRVWGVLLGLTTALALTGALLMSSYNPGWRGMLSLKGVALVAAPALFLSLSGYYLLARYLESPRDGRPPMAAWLSPTLGRGLQIAVLGYVAVMVWLTLSWNQAPATSLPDFAGQDRTIRGRGLVMAQIHVIESLIDKRGGFLRKEWLPPGVLLHNVHQWEKEYRSRLPHSAPYWTARFSKAARCPGRDGHWARAGQKWSMR